MRQGLIIFLCGMAWNAFQTAWWARHGRMEGTWAQHATDVVGLLLCALGALAIYRAGGYWRVRR